MSNKSNKNVWTDERTSGWMDGQNDRMDDGTLINTIQQIIYEGKEARLEQ